MDSQLKGELETEEFISEQWDYWLSHVIGANGFDCADTEEFYQEIILDRNDEGVSWKSYWAMNPWMSQFSLSALQEDIESEWNAYIDRRLDEWAGQKGKLPWLI